jgi:RNA-directed DNA polymerase
MTKAPSSLQELRRRIYRKAKSETTHRFWGLFVHITKIETLEEAYRIAKGNDGAPGIDGQSFRDIESAGRPAFLAAVREDLVTGSTNRGQTARWKSRRATANSEHCKYLASATAWCRER